MVMELGIWMEIIPPFFNFYHILLWEMRERERDRQMRIEKDADFTLWNEIFKQMISSKSHF